MKRLLILGCAFVLALALGGQAGAAGVKLNYYKATVSQDVYRVDDDLLMCTAEQTMVLVAGPDRRPTPISDAYRRAIAEFEGTDVELAVPVE